MMVTGYLRGHEIYWDEKSNAWLFTDDNSVAVEYDKDGNRISYERYCKRCGKMPTLEGYDACIGYIKGVKAACCGHGVEDGYRMVEEE
jgi:hypothetical protein